MCQAAHQLVAQGVGVSLRTEGHDLLLHLAALPSQVLRKLVCWATAGPPAQAGEGSVLCMNLEREVHFPAGICCQGLARLHEHTHTHCDCAAACNIPLDLNTVAPVWNALLQCKPPDAQS